MTEADWIIVAFTALLAGYGWLQGFVVGALSLAGFAAGAFLGTRLGPELLSEGARSPYAPLFGLLGALLAGGILASGLEGLGVHLRRRVTAAPVLGALDGALGAALTACMGLGIAWLAGAVALQTPGARELRAEIQRSAILRGLNEVLPPTGPILNALARFDPFPRISGPQVDVPAPRAAIARDPEVRGAFPAVVRILGTACGLGIEGSGWIAAPGLVVTNAHVVAGQQDTVVQVRGEDPQLGARAVWFDPRNDVAVLAVEHLAGAPLPLAGSPRPGTEGAILGYPENGPFDARAARLGSTRTVISRDAYGRGPVTRRMTALRGVVRSGNSGGPVVDGSGRVVTTVFAASTGGGPRGGYGVPNDVVRDALARARRPVDTGPCAR